MMLNELEEQELNEIKQKIPDLEIVNGILRSIDDLIGRLELKDFTHDDIDKIKPRNLKLNNKYVAETIQEIIWLYKLGISDQ